MTELRNAPRTYAVEFDFAKFFDNIDHDYLLAMLQRYFLISDQELALVKSFLKNSAAPSIDDYIAKRFSPRTRGIPQGSSLSLFLANAVCYELDRGLEKSGVVFARYADDTVILSDSYERAHQCSLLIHSHGRVAGPTVNHAKSPGISLVTPRASVRKAEVKATHELQYLGHSLSPDGVGLTDRTEKRIQQRVLRVLYDNLLLQPKRPHFNRDRVGGAYFDWDLVNTINELRRYIYGPLSESHVRDALENRVNVTIPRGAVAFFPLLEEIGEERLRALDGWMVDAIERTYRHRRQLLLSKFSVPFLVPARGTLLSGSWYSFPRIPVETQMPSFIRALRYVKKAALVFGLKRLPSPQSGYIG